ncbi:MAG: glycosyltransferase family 4 protein [Candidatus Zhuqueibacterota bacterium]
METNIAYVDELYHLVPHGGIAVWSKRLTDFLNTNGFHIDIFSFTKGIKNSIPDALKVFPNFREIFIYPGLGKRMFQNLEPKYKLVHLVSPHTLAWHKPAVPALTSVHYLISRQALMLGKYLPAKYKVFFNVFSYSLFLHYEKKGLQRADCITVSRQAYKEYLIQRMNIPAERIEIVKYGIDDAFFKPAEKFQEKENVAIYVGRGSLPKGFDTLVQAAPHINGKVIAVASQIPKHLLEAIARLKNFQVTTGISQEKLLELYRSALVFVMPSLTEGSPISTLEAMACGLPVVCTPEGSGEYIEDGVNGYIFPFKDPLTLADRVNYLFEHRDVAYEFGRLNREKVEKELTLPVIAAQMKAIYTRFLN